MGFSSKVFDRSKQFNEDLLNNIKGVLPLSDHPIGHSIHFLMILIENFFQCILISLLAPGDLFCLIIIHGALPFLDGK